jgi:hypothetical protein
MNMQFRPGPTLASVLEAVKNDSALDPKRKEDMTSAIRRVSIWSGQDLNHIPADAPSVRRIFDTIQPHAVGVTAKTAANVRSLCWRAVQASGLIEEIPVGHTRRKDKTPAWAKFSIALPTTRERNALSRLIRYCSDTGIEPADVTTQVIQSLVDHIDKTSVRRNVYKLHRSIAISWNLVVDIFPDLNLQKVSVPPSRLRKTRIPLSALSNEFLEDWAGYSTWAEGKDLFTTRQRRKKPLKQSTLDIMFRRLHRAINVLSELGVDPQSIRSLADLVEPQRVGAVLSHLNAHLNRWSPSRFSR